MLDKLGRKVQVGVFRRFAIMRHWNEKQNLPFPAFVSRDGLHMNDWSYGCTAHLLAGAILDAVARQSVADRSGEPASGVETAMRFRKPALSAISDYPIAKSLPVCCARLII